jgi:hypothetical protein
MQADPDNFWWIVRFQPKFLILLQRPLTQDMIEYASQDVLYLAQVYEAF